MNTLMQWVMAGQLIPSMRLGRLVRFSESYIHEVESKGGVNNIKGKGMYFSKVASQNSISDHISLEDDGRDGLEIKSKGGINRAS